MKKYDHLNPILGNILARISKMIAPPMIGATKFNIEAYTIVMVLMIGKLQCALGNTSAIRAFISIIYSAYSSSILNVRRALNRLLTNSSSGVKLIVPSSETAMAKYPMANLNSQIDNKRNPEKTKAVLTPALLYFSGAFLFLIALLIIQTIDKTNRSKDVIIKITVKTICPFAIAMSPIITFLQFLILHLTEQH